MEALVEALKLAENIIFFLGGGGLNYTILVVTLKWEEA